MTDLYNIIKNMVDNNASDLHIKTNSPPLIRVQGNLQPLNAPPLSFSDIKNICKTIMSEEQWQKFQDEKFEIDLAHTPKEDDSIRLRINIFKQKGTIEMIMRLIPKNIPTIEDLHLPNVLKKIALLKRGLVLVTGSVGSGKSTTIASMINYINIKKACHIVTIEDPIEFVFNDNLSSISQREIGIDTESYSKALKYVLRQDPDVIYIGEIRDLETVSSAMSVAETGHLVFSTLHTIDASQTIDRVVDFFPSSQHSQIRSQFANTIEAVISLRLMEKSDKTGRVPAVEVMIGTSTIKSLIREDKVKEIRGQIHSGINQYGMQTFDQSLISLYKKKLITMEDCLAQATSSSDVKLAISGIVSSSASAKSIIK